jgi:holo-[acyl-carrier protein] synthase
VSPSSDVSGGAPAGIRAVGTDFVSVARVREALARQPRLKAVCFTSAEIEYCELSADPAERFAARWAAKEAVLKCLGGMQARSDFAEIEVWKATDGAPGLRCSGQVLGRAMAAEIACWHLSLSHDGGFAVAFVIAS